MKKKSAALAASILLALACVSGQVAAAPPTGSAPTPVDRGPAATVAHPMIMSVTVALKLADSAGAEQLFARLYDRSSPQFHQFLSPSEFRQAFAPKDADVAQVSSRLAGYGLTVERASTSHLKVTGTTDQLERAFNTRLHQFAVAAHDQHNAYSYVAPTTHPVVSADIAPLVHGVFGLSTKPIFTPHMQQASMKTLSGIKATVNPASTGALASGNLPGAYTVKDFAQQYHVNPLYKKGISGEGRSLAIATLAAFTPSDAFAYWQAVGLKVSPNRLKIVDVDGGPGAPSDASGSVETTLDVEQAGGIAPKAKIIVYQAPNTSQGFVDVFAAAIDANQAESISTSWGSWEWFYTADNDPVTDPFTGKTVGSLQAMHELFIQAAIQGQTLFSASGDAGAYDVNRNLLPPAFSLVLSVDYPASDPAMTAAGGTTLPVQLTFSLPNGPSFPVTIQQEQAWSWSYLDPLCTYLQLDPLSCGIFPVGSGGGVSVEWRRPWYQQGIPGVENSQPLQSLIEYLPAPAVDYFDLPANYAGRNVPDISANADPYTGYSVVYTSSATGLGVVTGEGGTSFVSPQLNGVTALIGEYIHGRVGFLNPELYRLSRFNDDQQVIKPIAHGDNGFYQGTRGYNPAAGLGVIDAAALADALKDRF